MKVKAYLDVAECVGSAEADVHREERVGVRRRDHEFSRARAVGTVDELDGPKQLAVPRIILPVTVDLQAGPLLNCCTKSS